MSFFLKEKLSEAEARFQEIEAQLSDPKVYAQQGEAERLGKQRAELEPIVETGAEYEKALEGLQQAREALELDDSEEWQALAQAEAAELEAAVETLELRLKTLFLPKDANDDKNIMLEIRSGTGGLEAALFAADLLRMYARYAERIGWKVETVSSNETELGGFREAIVSVSGERVYSRLKFESGIHRVQRVPETESSGRIHTSAVTVAALPEAEAVDVDLDPNDVKMERFRSGGPGGQHANMTDSAVRLTHVPTGIVVVCRDERSQHKNRAKAEKALLARLYDHKMREQNAERTDARKSMVGSGDRSEKIRTYNFLERRVTDHRIGLTLYQLETILDGGLDALIDPLIEADQTAKLQSSLTE
ncbi:MAG: peptide chain release factor 1 [Candidatus Poribacteria bacterium]|nr:peptide chain release factor 1 [Candidatus Poribacteria bacterium]